MITQQLQGICQRGIFAGDDQIDKREHPGSGDCRCEKTDYRYCAKGPGTK